MCVRIRPYAESYSAVVFLITCFATIGQLDIVIRYETRYETSWYRHDIAAVHNVHKSKLSCDWQLCNLCQEGCLAVQLDVSQKTTPEYHLSMQKLHNNGPSFPQRIEIEFIFAVRAVVSPLFAFAYRSNYQEKQTIRNVRVIIFSQHRFTNKIANIVCS